MFGVKLLWCFFLFCAVVKSSKTISIDVPSMIVLDGQHSRTQLLNCSHDFDADNSSLVVKWYKDDEAVYQWIKGNAPTVFDRFKNLVDDSFETSTSPDHQYSGLALTNLNINSTGTYKCVVQATKDSSMDQKHMQIIDVSQHELNIQRKKYPNDSYIECTVLNVYPKPSMKVIYGQMNDNNEEISTTPTTILESENGFFNGTTTTPVSDNNIESYRCVVNFMNFDFQLKTNAFSSSEKTFFYKVLLLFVFLIV